MSMYIYQGMSVKQRAFWLSNCPSFRWVLGATGSVTGDKIQALVQGAQGRWGQQLAESLLPGGVVWGPQGQRSCRGLHGADESFRLCSQKGRWTCLLL